MKAFAMTGFGGNEVMQLIELDIPTPTENEALIKIYYAGVNPVDWKIRQGYLKNYFPHVFPMVLGRDVAGVIVKVGKNVTQYKVGDFVYANVKSADKTYGGYAEYIALDQDTLSLVPKNIDSAQAGGLPLVALTAWQAITDRIKANKGDSILILGGASAVGAMAIQFAKLNGLVIYTTASKASHDYVTSLGANFVYDYKHDYVDQLPPLDCLFDCAGGEALNAPLVKLKNKAKLVTIVGGLSEASSALLKEKNVSMDFIMTNSNGAQLKEISNLIEQNRVQPLPVSEYPFDKIGQALTDNQTGRVKGKLVINIAGI